MPPAAPPHGSRAGRAARRCGAGLALTLAALLPAAAQSPSAPRSNGTVPTPNATEPTDARAWLARIHAAANQGNYQGTMVFSAGGMLSSSRVAHFAVGAESYERLEALDGRLQRVYRHNDAVHTLWPQARIAVVERRTPLTRLPSSMQTVEPRALEQYALQADGSDRVAGRQALVFRLQPRDAHRYAQRLWIDRDSGLMLRADVIDAEGRVLESSAFSEVEIGVRPQPETVTRVAEQLDGYRIVRPQQQRTELEGEGWTLPRAVPGFLLSACVRRPLPGAAATAAAAPGTVVQAVFSDGLTHVSVFIEPGEGRGAFKPMSAQMGATATHREQREGHWLTVMGDVPAPTLRLFAQALQRRR